MSSVQQISAAFKTVIRFAIFFHALEYKLVSPLKLKSLGLASIILAFLMQTHIIILKAGLL